MFATLKRLFNRAVVSDTTPDKGNAHHYNGYNIFVAPISEAGQYRVAGWIEKIVPSANASADANVNTADSGESLLQHRFIRSDLCASQAQAESITLQKCKLFIDQSGDSMFN